jgi:hypothetical protein
MSKQILPIVAVVVLITLGTLYEGKVTERWAKYESERLRLFTEQLDDVPASFDSWEGVETPLTEEAFAATNCTGYVSRVYKNTNTAEEVSVYLVAGTARHITIHTPDWCYPGAGFEKEEDVTPHIIDCGGEPPMPVAFSTAVFRKEELSEIQRLRIFWSYSEDGVWEGPTLAKARYANRPALYKVYLIAPAPSDQTPDDSPSVEFAKVFMPLLNRILFPPAAEDKPGEAA